MKCEAGTSVRSFVQDFYRRERVFSYRWGYVLLVMMLSLVLLSGFVAWVPEIMPV